MWTNVTTFWNHVRVYEILHCHHRMPPSNRQYVVWIIQLSTGRSWACSYWSMFTPKLWFGTHDQRFQARREKAARTKHLGSPIQLIGKALSIQISDNYAWIAENTAVVRKIDLEVGNSIVTPLIYFLSDIVRENCANFQRAHCASYLPWILWYLRRDGV